MSMSMAADPDPLVGPEQKVLKRALVSKMARALQDRLALANVKIKHGWQNRSIQSLAPELALELKRKRSDPINDAHSDSASSVSGGRCFSNAPIGSSPMTAPLFSDDIARSGSTNASSRKRMRPAPAPRPSHPMSSTHARSKRRAPGRTVHSWKSDFHLPQSSPITHTKPVRPTLASLQNLSFMSSDSTIMDSPSASEDDDQDLPLHSFQIPQTHLTSSPPRTPSPTLARSARLRSTTFTSAATPSAGGMAKEGADLLLYLATSPSPATGFAHRGTTEMFPPSTPPSRSALPSSMMSTPGTHMFMGFGGPQTPNAAPFDFAAFVNITPSPAQGSWTRTPRTPATAKTPVAYREARRKLTFDAMPPPPTQPAGSVGRASPCKDPGPGMELGGELMP